MSSPDLAAAAVALARRTRAEQGLPRHVEDDGALERIARLLDAAAAPDRQVAA